MARKTALQTEKEKSRTFGITAEPAGPATSTEITKAPFCSSGESREVLDKSRKKNVARNSFFTFFLNFYLIGIIYMKIILMFHI